MTILDTLLGHPKEIKTWWSRIWANGSPTAAHFRKQMQADFAEDVGKASKLLDFLITEGRSEHITDQIIEDIEKAREQLTTPDRISYEDRAKLSRALRDLVLLPKTVMTFDGVPPAPFWSLSSGWLWVVFAFVALPAIGLLFLLYHLPNPAQKTNQVDQDALTWLSNLVAGHYYYLIAYFVIAPSAVWAAYAFSGVATNHKLSQAIKACYAFTFAATIIAISPFWLPVPWGQGIGLPANILQGCVQSEANQYASEISCDKIQGGVQNHKYQWVINIGGIIDKTDGPSAGQKVQPPAPAPGKHLPRHRARKDPQIASAPNSRPSQEGGPYRIRGGLVVPLYVAVLAMIGGAVSMTRQVPEYQRLAMSTQEPFTNEEARRALIFQIMQFVSAPLIAFVAYYIYRPSDPVASVILGFGSGFSSEPILRLMRSLAEKLSPTPKTEPDAVNVRVNPPSADVEPGRSKQFSALVTGSPNSDVTWHIDPVDGSGGTILQSGNYVAPPTPLTRKIATITAVSAADPKKSGSATITITEAAHHGSGQGTS